MASLQQSVINDTGYLKLPSGTTAQRPTAAVGQIRYNTDLGVVEFYMTKYNSTQPNASQVSDPQFNAQVITGWHPLTTPFLVREIITHQYAYGGYKNSSVWQNVNRTVASTDTTTNLGNLLSIGFNYKGGACGQRRAWAFGAGGGHNVSSTNTTGYDMISETTLTIRARTNMANTRGQTGVVFKEKETAWVCGGGVSSIEEFDLLTETFRSFTLGAGSATQMGGDGGGPTGQGPWAMSHELYGIWYSGDSAGAFNGGAAAAQNFTFATKTSATRSGTQPGYHHQQKAINSKLQNGYAGTDGSYAGGYSYRRTNFYTNTTSSGGVVTKAYGNSGEENYTMGNDWSYMLGQHDGAQNNKSAKFVYATETQTTGSSTLEPKGNDGMSSAVTSWRGA